MSDDRVDERLARLRRATDGVTAPGLDERILAAIAARERDPGRRWDALWRSSRGALVISLGACAASVAIAIHYDATLVTTLASDEDGGADIAMGEP